MRFTGIALLFFTVVSGLHFGMIEQHFTNAESLEMADQFIEHNEWLFRFGIIHDLVIFTGGIAMALGLYSLLSKTKRPIAAMATALLLVAFGSTFLVELTSFAILIVAKESPNAAVFNLEQLHWILNTLLQVRVSGYAVMMFLYALSMGLFSYLFAKSKILAPSFAYAWLASFVLMFVATVGIILVPSELPLANAADTFNRFASSPVMLLQVVAGIMLLVQAHRNSGGTPLA